MVVNKHLLFYLLFLLPSVVLSQENILKRKINYQAQDLALESVLLGIANVGNFSFSYNPQIISGDSTMSLTVENSSVKEVMDAIFDGKLVYKVSGNHLILLADKPAKAKEKATYSVSGYVYDANTGERLTSTTIYEVYTLTSTYTDEQGFYSIDITQKC